MLVRILPRKELSGKESGVLQGEGQTFQYSSPLPLAGHAAFYRALQTPPLPYARGCSELAGCHSLATDFTRPASPRLPLPAPE